MENRRQFADNVETVAVVGLGLLGGSLALRLKQLLPDLRVLGLARRDESVKQAVAEGIIDDGATVPEAVLPQADLSILCTPVTSIVDLGREYAALWRAGAIVTDVGSVKAPIVRALTPALADHDVAFVGSHPMAGSEKAGLAHAVAALYQGSTVLVTPGSQTHPHALAVVTAMWQTVGANPVEMPPEVHDDLVGRTSHLIHLLAAAAVDVCLESDDAPYTTGGGFRDFTRIAAGSPPMWRQIFEMNQTSLLDAIDAYQKKLIELRQTIKNGNWQQIEDYLATCGALRTEWFQAWARACRENEPRENV